MTMPSPLLPILAAHTSTETPKIPKTSNINQLIHHVSLKRAHYRIGHPIRVCWHPYLPILCTQDDVSWWNTDGTFLTRVSDLGYGIWSTDGSEFWCVGTDLYDDTRTAVWYDNFVADTRITLPISAKANFLAVHPYESIACVPIAYSGEGLYALGLWNVTTEKVHPLPGTLWHHNLLRWSPDGRFLCGVTQDPQNQALTLHILARDGTVLLSRLLPAKWIDATIWSPDSRWIIVYGDAALFWWEIESERMQQIRHQGPIATYEYFKWSPNGEYLAAMVNRSLMLFDREGTIIREWQSPDRRAIINCTWHPISGDLITATSQGQIVWWDSHGKMADTFVPLRPEMPIAGPACGPFSLAWDATGTYLAAGLYDCTVQIYRLGEERP